MKRLSTQILNRFEEMFISGHLKTGDRLPPERELCKEFRVSRPVLREAIRNLEQRGLLDVQPGRGIFVGRQSLDYISGNMEFSLKMGDISFPNLLEARYNLEIWIASLAAVRRTEADLRQLANHLTQMENSFWDNARFIACDQAFHLQLALSTQNPLYSLWINPIINALSTTRSGVATLKPIREQVVECHKNIFVSIKQSDAKSACDAMKNHLKQFVDATVLAAEIGIIEAEDFGEIEWIVNLLG
jgi:GntR family transcriptional repressor for pyruvate dehydrogenase complex